MLSVLWLVGVGAAAQAVAEYAATSSTVSAGATEAKATHKIFSRTSAGKKPPFLHIAERAEEPAYRVNRRALEERAGKNGAKLLLRSEPTRAQVWIEGKLVGRTPLLLILPPGTYRVEMRASRMETAQTQIDVAPEKIQETRLTLVPRYPTQVRLR